MNMIKNKLNILAFIVLQLLCVATFSCQRKDSGSGGTVVGNGFIRYHDQSYDYFFEYARSLTLKKLSNSSIRLDNEDYANKIGGRYSEISLSVKKLTDFGVNSLSEYTKQIDSDSDWTPVAKVKTEGLFIREISAGQLQAHYVFNLSKGHILDVTANAVQDADGIKLISDVISSLNFDTQSPVIHEMIFVPSIAVAGTKVKLRIRATDNLTAIRGESPTGSVARREQRQCRKLTTANWETVDACGDFRPLGDDWYEFDVPTDSKMKPGAYFLYPLTIWDNAGNSTELVPDTERLVYRTGLLANETLLPMAMLQIRNDQPDTEAPSLSNVRFEPAEIDAGQDTKLVFTADDNDPNFSPSNFCHRALHPDWFRYTRSDVPKNAEIDPTEYAVHACSTPKKRNDGAWEVQIDTKLGTPPGQYIMDFNVRDNVGNTSKPVNAVLTVHNTGKVDTEGPRILHIKTDRTTYNPGDRGLILIQATDDLSGIANQNDNFGRSFCRGSMVTDKLAEDDSNMHDRVLICDGNLKHLEGDWYVLEFKLPEQVPTGDYYLPEISLSDNIGNRTFLSSKKGDLTATFYEDTFNKLTTSLPVLAVKVAN